MAGRDDITGGGLVRGRPGLACGAEGEQIIAAPTVIKKLLLRRLIRDMSQRKRICLGLELRKSKLANPSSAQ